MGDLRFTIEVTVPEHVLREEYERMEEPRGRFEEYVNDQPGDAADALQAWWTDDRIQIRTTRV